MAAIDRRTFLLLSAAGMLAPPLAAQSLDDIPIIETTPHLYDPKRPQGVPYAVDPEGMTAAKLKAKAPAGVRGAIVVEASPWIEDNLWLLEAAEQDPFVVGVVGNLRPEHKEFPEFVARFGKNPLYLGIRHGNLWGYNLARQLDDPQFVAGLKVLAEADMVLDLSNPQLDLLQAAVRTSDLVPNLRIIVDHLAGFYPAPEEWLAVDAVLREIAGRPHIYGKISGFMLRGPQNTPALTVAMHRERLDKFFAAFGEDRVFGGAYSDESIKLYRAYLAGKPRSLAENFFWKNSAKICRWKPRSPDQPRLT
jgi:L-fuconolactonase